jgi:hypothetical protein
VPEKLFGANDCVPHCHGLSIEIRRNDERDLWPPVSYAVARRLLPGSISILRSITFSRRFALPRWLCALPAYALAIGQTKGHAFFGAEP